MIYERFFYLCKPYIAYLCYYTSALEKEHHGGKYMLRDNSKLRVQTSFYDDSNPYGIKMAEMRNSNIQAVFVPRALLPLLKDEEEVQRPTLYFLFGRGRQAYIGEAAKGYDRLKQHASPNGKEFWDIAVMIIAKNYVYELDKADVQRLEYLSFVAATKADTYNLNQTVPTFPDADQFRLGELHDVLENIKRLLGALGFPLLGEQHNIQNNVNVSETVVIQQKEVEQVAQNEIINTFTSNDAEAPKPAKEVKITSNALADELFYLATNGSAGIGKKVGENFLVCKGSVLGNRENTNFLDNNNYTHDQKLKILLSSGVIEKQEGTYVFLEDHLFDSTSAASNFVAQTRCSGPSVWRDKDGVKLKDYEAQPV